MQPSVGCCIRGLTAVLALSNRSTATDSLLLAAFTTLTGPSSVAAPPSSVFRLFCTSTLWPVFLGAAVQVRGVGVETRHILVLLMNVCKKKNRRKKEGKTLSLLIWFCSEAKLLCRPGKEAWLILNRLSLKSCFKLLIGE